MKCYQQLASGSWKEFSKVYTTLEGFLSSVKVWEKMEKSFWRGIFYQVVGVGRGAILTWTSIKTKISVTCVYKEYELKSKWYRSKTAAKTEVYIRL